MLSNKEHRLIMCNARRICNAHMRRSNNWVLAMNLFGLGSNSARQLCEEAGIDPDATIINSVRQPAEQPAEQEFIALVVGHDMGRGDFLCEVEIGRVPDIGTKLYLAPPQQAEQARDTERLDWLESEVKFRSVGGVTINHTIYAEEGRILEKGFRLVWRHFQGKRMPTLREAIDAAMQKGDV